MLIEKADFDRRVELTALGLSASLTAAKRDPASAAMGRNVDAGPLGALPVPLRIAPRRRGSCAWHGAGPHRALKG
jgi:hypothetical protein